MHRPVRSSVTARLHAALDDWLDTDAATLGDPELLDPDDSGPDNVAPSPPGASRSSPRARVQTP